MTKTLCRDCASEFDVRALNHVAWGSPINHCPFCGSKEVGPSPEPSPEDRQKAVENAARKGFSET